MKKYKKIGSERKFRVENPIKELTSGNIFNAPFKN